MDNNIAHKELKLEIEIKIVSAHCFDIRDRFLLFDEHSAIYIHDINSWSSKNDKLRKDTQCSIMSPNDKKKKFNEFYTNPVLGSIKPIKYYI